MAKLWAYLKTEARLIGNQLPKLLLFVLLLPFAMSIFMSSSFETVYEPDTTIEPIGLNLVNEDQGELGRQLEKFLASPDMEDMVDLDEDGDFTLHIQEGYSEDLASSRLTIEGKKNASQIQGQILQELLNHWQENLVKIQSLQEVKGPQAMDLVQKMAQSWEKYEAGRPVREEYKTAGMVNSSQYMSLSSVLLICFIFLFSQAKIRQEDQFLGLRKRLGIIPLTSGQKTAFFSLSMLLTVLVFSGAYMVLWKVFDATTFPHNPMAYILWIGLSTLLNLGIVSLAFAIFPDKFAYTILHLVYIAYLFLVWMPMGDMIEGPVGDFMKANSMKVYILDPAMTYIRTGGVGEMVQKGRIILPLAILFLVLAAAIQNHKEVTR